MMKGFQRQVRALEVFIACWDGSEQGRWGEEGCQPLSAAGVRSIDLTAHGQTAGLSSILAVVLCRSGTFSGTNVSRVKGFEIFQSSSAPSWLLQSRPCPD